jgi:hypothetical protein
VWLHAAGKSKRDACALGQHGCSMKQAASHDDNAAGRQYWALANFGKSRRSQGQQQQLITDYPERA